MGEGEGSERISKRSKSMGTIKMMVTGIRAQTWAMMNRGVMAMSEKQGE